MGRIEGWGHLDIQHSVKQANSWKWLKSNAHAIYPTFWHNSTTFDLKEIKFARMHICAGKP
jgi:hypothetical protein